MRHDYSYKTDSVDYLTGNRVQIRSSTGSTVMGEAPKNKGIDKVELFLKLSRKKLSEYSKKHLYNLVLVC